MKSLSIIVPVYNVEKYMVRCLDSLLEQDISKKEYEIIIVNDGATDNSPVIAKKYVAENKNIRLFNQENQGLGGARNTGIHNATGNYLIFVDSDDYIEENCLSFLLKQAEKQNLDVLHYNYEEVDTNYQIIPKKKSATYAAVFKNDIIDGKKFLSERLGWACYVWTYLFKTSFLRKGKFVFEKGIYFEDVEWLPRVLIQAQRVNSINRHVYNYLRRANSITKAVDIKKKEKLLNDKIQLIDNLIQITKDVNHKKVTNWCEGLIALSTMSILSSVGNIFPEKTKDIVKELRDRNVFPLRAHNFTAKQIMNAFIINISPYVYCRLKRYKN